MITALLNTLTQAVPLPRDLPLPLPLPEWLLVFLLVFSFLLHILFVNLMLGGAILTLWAELKGKKEKGYNLLAREIANTITVNKSLAVVIGVAPLLSINVLYTIYFYSANTLTGIMWISIVPLVTVAFLLIYLHKYTWERFEGKKNFHIGIMALAVLILLFVPFIFLTNINLMLFPQKWVAVKGFFSAMWMANVIPRYLHFLCASLAVTGLFLFGYMKRRKYIFNDLLPGFDKSAILKKWYHVAMGATLLQLALGPLNLFTLPWFAVTWGLGYIVITGVILALIAIYFMWRELKGPGEKLGRLFYPIALILTLVVLLMGTGRHIYRAVALAPHRQKMEQKTQKYLEMIRSLKEEKKEVNETGSPVIDQK